VVVGRGLWAVVGLALLTRSSVIGCRVWVVGSGWCVVCRGSGRSHGRGLWVVARVSWVVGCWTWWLWVVGPGTCGSGSSVLGRGSWVVRQQGSRSLVVGRRSWVVGRGSWVVGRVGRGRLGSLVVGSVVGRGRGRRSSVVLVVGRGSWAVGCVGRGRGWWSWVLVVEHGGGNMEAEAAEAAEAGSGAVC